MLLNSGIDLRQNKGYPLRILIKGLPLFLAILLALGCGDRPTMAKEKVISNEKALPSPQPAINEPQGNTIATRFSPPEGYQRTTIDSNSFQGYLRHLPLKESHAPVRYFDGTVKRNTNIYAAVIDLPIGKRNLHQCADAVMRLRAEYLFHEKKYDSIGFNFTNGFRADYSKWRTGMRISVSGNAVRWTSGATASTSYADFWKYLEMVFSYAGTASLAQELKPISIDAIAIGDVFIQGGFPGHAIIVVDMARQVATGKKQVLLAQSYMPAQDIQILKNPNDPQSPWYPVNSLERLHTPEWTFENSDLRRF